MKPFYPFAFLALFAAICTTIIASESVTPKDFTLKSIDGKHEFQLSKAKTELVALHFLLKTECPICLRYTQEYTENAKKHPNVTHIFIKPDEPEESQKWIAKYDDSNSKQPVIYHDKNAQLAKKYKIKDGYKFHGEVVHYPAFILVDKNGKEHFRYVGTKTQDRFFYKEFAKKIDEMK